MFSYLCSKKYFSEGLAYTLPVFLAKSETFQNEESMSDFTKKGGIKTSVTVNTNTNTNPTSIVLVNFFFMILYRASINVKGVVV
jgi:hypothetical protein